MPTKIIRERDIEQHLVRRVKAFGGIAYKFTSPAQAGVPDRLVLLPGGRVHLVELKSPTGKSSPLQLMEQARIRSLGVAVWVLDSIDAVEAWLEGATR